MTGYKAGKRVVINKRVDDYKLDTGSQIIIKKNNLS